MRTGRFSPPYFSLAEAVLAPGTELTGVVESGSMLIADIHVTGDAEARRPRGRALRRRSFIGSGYADLESQRGFAAYLKQENWTP